MVNLEQEFTRDKILGLLKKAECAFYLIFVFHLVIFIPAMISNGLREFAHQYSSQAFALCWVTVMWSYVHNARVEFLKLDKKYQNNEAAPTS